MDTCEHAEEMRTNYADYVGPFCGPFCEEWAPHSPHDGCMGIMCDYGCNEMEF